MLVTLRNADDPIPSWFDSQLRAIAAYNELFLRRAAIVAQILVREGSFEATYNFVARGSDRQVVLFINRERFTPSSILAVSLLLLLFIDLVKTQMAVFWLKAFVELP